MCEFTHMSRPYKIVKNTSKWPLEVLVPLLDLAWDVAWRGKDPRKIHPRWQAHWSQEAVERSCVYAVAIRHNSRTARGRAWASRCLLSLGYGDRIWPMRLNYSRYKDMPEYEAANWHEMIVHIAAHEFAHLTGHGGKKKGEEMCELTAWDAIDTYRKRQPEIDGKIEAALQNTRQRAQAALQRVTDKKAERASPEYKLAVLARKEKVWLRKLRLALSKMKGIKRSRAAIIRWQNKKADALTPMAQAASTEPPCAS